MLKYILIILLFSSLIFARKDFEKDIIKTNKGDLEITFIGHGTLMFSYNDKIIHIDPFSKLADYSSLPDADLILITHHHGDHLDTAAISKITNKNTEIILTEPALKNVNTDENKKYTVLKNGDIKKILGLNVEAVPAYNLVHKRDNGEPFHPKGTCNGYIISFGDKRVYVAGDTENIPEMKNFDNIDVAFLPMNLPYTMTPEMAADAAKSIHPKIFYPYHYGDTDISKLEELMKDQSHIEMRIRKME